MAEFGWAVRSRSVRGSFWTDEDVSSLEPLTRLVLIGLFAVADREGRFPNRPAKIARLLFPGDGLDVAAAMAKLARARFLVFYEVDGMPLVYIRNFKRFQHVHPSEAKSILPEPKLGPIEPKLGPIEIQLRTNLDPSESRSEPSEPSEPSGKTSVGGESPRGEHSASQAKPPRKTRKTPGTPRPEDLAPNDTTRAVAAKLGVNLGVEFPKFCDHHDSKDSRFAGEKGWQAAIRTWVRNVNQFARAAPPRVNELPGRERSGPGTTGGMRRIGDDAKLGAPSTAAHAFWCSPCGMTHPRGERCPRIERGEAALGVNA